MHAHNTGTLGPHMQGPSNSSLYSAEVQKLHAQTPGGEECSPAAKVGPCLQHTVGSQDTLNYLSIHYGQSATFTFTRSMSCHPNANRKRTLFLLLLGCVRHYSTEQEARLCFPFNTTEPLHPCERSVHPHAVSGQLPLACCLLPAHAVCNGWDAS